MDYTSLSNTELVRLCGREPKNRSAWIEFHTRFDQRIRLFAYRECRKQIGAGPPPFSQVVQDIVQDVYLTLIRNQGKALKAFKGLNENSIYLYLGVIVKNIVSNYLYSITPPRLPALEKSLDATVYDHQQKTLLLRDSLCSDYIDTEEQVLFQDFLRRIEEILDQEYLEEDRERNRLIFKLFFLEGFDSNAIAEQFGFALSAKRVANLICLMRNALKDKLKRP